ncbi:MGA protein, partial [Pomatostomus ruficeps]|nr:MGA protein [Pomatostomus ruficeps]
DVQYSDIDYMDRQVDFTISSSFLGLPALIDKIKAEGMRFIIILDPAISANQSNYPAYTRGVENDVFIKRPDTNEILYSKVWSFLPNVQINESLPHETQVELYAAHAAFPDFFRRSTADWWKREILEVYNNPNASLSLKFDGLWIDMNEPAAFVNGAVDGCRNDLLNNPPYMPHLGSRSEGLSFKTACMEALHRLTDRSTVRHYDVHNLYGWSQTKPTLQALHSITKERGIVITRSTYPGSGRWAGHWLGDNTAAWDQLHKSIIGACLEKGLGSWDPRVAERLGLEEKFPWFFLLSQAVPFSFSNNSLLLQRQDPAAWNSTFVDASRSVLNTRYRLLPYLYTLLHDAHAHGSTVVRPLLHEFVEDRTTWDIDAQFLWGPALLISPVLKQNERTVRAYFPNARWYDFFTEIDTGFRGQFQTIPAPLDHINLHIRGGYILPLQMPANTTVYSRKNTMALTVALDDALFAEGHLYWDDGVRIGT